MKSGVEVDVSGEAVLGLELVDSPSLWKKNLFLQVEWSRSKSFFISPMFGSPGVGQNPFPRDRTLSSSDPKGQLLRLTTLVGVGACSISNLASKLLTMSITLVSNGGLTLLRLLFPLQHHPSSSVWCVLGES